MDLYLICPKCYHIIGDYVFKGPDFFYTTHTCSNCGTVDTIAKFVCLKLEPSLSKFTIGLMLDSDDVMMVSSIEATNITHAIELYATQHNWNNDPLWNPKQNTYQGNCLVSITIL